jgi:hypothetical protein
MYYVCSYLYGGGQVFSEEGRSWHTSVCIMCVLMCLGICPHASGCVSSAAITKLNLYWRSAVTKLNLSAISLGELVVEYVGEAVRYCDVDARREQQRELGAQVLSLLAVLVQKFEY